MTTSFETLGLKPELIKAVTELGYATPTPIQSGAIPVLLEGRDVLGQAQTGTGKTAAFALPLLHSLDPDLRGVQGLILTPTRELATQVSSAVHRYGIHCNARVLPIYGGQPYIRQKRRLEQGVQVVVGTPGRMLDLIRQGVLALGNVRYLVLDEADEMLKMGFLEDVETILAETPSTRQTALFSATLPEPIRHLAGRYMHDPVNVNVRETTRTVAQTEQRYYLLEESSKVAAVTRILEVETIKSALIFTRTRAGASELCEILLARGYPAEALHGDMSQAVRESVLRRFRQGQVTVLVATDVMARGLDIQDVSHVINYDMPHDADDYIHRIGRTGRAGRSGVALTLVTPRERRRIQTIERFTRQSMTRATLPGPEEVQACREARFQQELHALLEAENLDREIALVTRLTEAGYDLTTLTAAAIRLARADELQRPIDDVREVSERPVQNTHDRDRRSSRRTSVPEHTHVRLPRRTGHEPGMVRLSLDLGHAHGIKPADVVGAIASEAGIPGRGIGAIDIHQYQTFIDVNERHVAKVLRQMQGSRLRGQSATFVQIES